MGDYVAMVDKLMFAYPYSSNSINDISFSISKGDCVGLIGANGAGKSTLISLLCGVNFADSGAIEICGEKINKQNIRLIRKKIGVVFQNPDEQLFTTKVYDDVAFAPRNMGLSVSEVESRSHLALTQMGIEHLANRPPYRLSDGEKRKAAIAAVLSMQPELLLLDEPTATLDPRARRQLMTILSSLTQTKLIATHDLDLVLGICNKVILLCDGKIAASGDSSEILHDKKLLEDNGLELPLGLQK